VSPWGKLTELAFHPTKKVNKADEKKSLRGTTWMALPTSLFCKLNGLVAMHPLLYLA
jgi:hypothetical protein